jgi:hypothetical protein
MNGDMIGAAVGWILTLIQMLPGFIAQIFGGGGG